MKYGYTVKYNGEYYPTGMDVPEKEEKKVEAEEKASVLLDEEDTIPKKRGGRPKKER